MEHALTLHLNLIVVDPDWSPIYGENRCAVNMDTRHIYRDFEVEVLTVHFKKNSMRIRFHHGGRVETRDVDAAPFFEKYKVVEV